MKKIIFSGRLTNDKQMFVEIAFCGYNYEKFDGKKKSAIYVSFLGDDGVKKHGVVFKVITKVDDLVYWVERYGFNQKDIEELIKGINKHPFEAIAVFGTEAESHLCERLRASADEVREAAGVFN